MTPEKEETIVQARAPNVLTLDEARLLIGALDEVDFEHWEPLGELEKRLKVWAEENNHA